ncbi:uncharacterized protein PRCAT00001789001 [Priceomyces carsonii]|uniref:uncharacterized protein n=1 Tax=Priceomyces carsonii TaxID=28549 RepID=UPI002EDAA845|nr:unnamed protein product [Priceomyces carsonii]
MSHSKDVGKSLFIDDDHEMEEESISDEPSQNIKNKAKEDEDPVIESIPIVLSKTPRSSQTVHAFQYQGRPKTHPFKETRLKASIKKESNFVEMQVPINTHKFYDISRSEEWGSEMSKQRLHGVLNKTNGGMYVGQLVKSGESKKLVLTPVDSTVQLRPVFSYLDELDASRALDKKSEVVDHLKSSSIQILQTSAKSNSLAPHNDAYGNVTLGESLKHLKKFEEEEWSALSCKAPSDQDSVELKLQIQNGGNGVKLRCNSNMDSYLSSLISS